MTGPRRRTDIPRFTALGFAVVTLLIGGACTDGGDSPAGPASTDSDASDPPEAATSTSTTSTATSVEPSFDAELGEPVTGLDEPVDLAVHEGRTYLVERPGLISSFDARGRGATALDISDSTVAEGERGLLGLAFSPDHAYVNYTDVDGNTVIDRFTVESDGSFDIGSRTTLLTITPPYPNHNGGDLLFDAASDSLLVFTGDGGAGGDPERLALDTGSLLGKILRLRHPADANASMTPEIAAAGLRNPWRVSVDAATGLLYIADVGQGEWEEVSRVPVDAIDGRSFGWSAFEGTHPFNTDQLDDNGDFTYVEPFHEYRHSDGNCSISGGAVYRGSIVPAEGAWYVYADYCSGAVRAVLVTDGEDDGDVVEVGQVTQPVAVVADSEGELWVLSLDGSATPIVAR